MAVVRRPMKQDAQEREKSGLLSDVSFSTVIATSLAAVTSFVLMSKIGLAGSLIGTGLAAAASSMATQVYKGMLTRSASKLRAMAPGPEGSPSTEGSPARGVEGTALESNVNAAAITRDQLGGLGGHETLSDKTSPHLMVAATGTPVAPERIRLAAAAREARDMRRKVTAVASIVAIVVALATAGIIALATNGLGLWNDASEPVEEYYEDGYYEDEGTYYDEQAPSDTQMVTTTEPATSEATPTSVQETAPVASETTSAATPEANAVASSATSDVAAVATDPATVAPSATSESATGEVAAQADAAASVASDAGASSNTSSVTS